MRDTVLRNALVEGRGVHDDNRAQLPWCDAVMVQARPNCCTPVCAPELRLVCCAVAVAGH